MEGSWTTFDPKVNTFKVANLNIDNKIVTNIQCSNQTIYINIIIWLSYPIKKHGFPNWLNVN